MAKKITFSKFSKDMAAIHKNGGDEDASISEYMQTNHLLRTDCVPYRELLGMASEIVQNTCYIDNKFVVNTNAIELSVAVYNFMACVSLDYSKATIGDIYDVIRNYHLNFDCSELMRCVNNIISDINRNEFSLEALCAAILEKASDEAVSDEVINAVTAQLVQMAKDDTDGK